MVHNGTPSPDVAVVGAGIVGAACTYYLARAGAMVKLFDRDFPASGTSGACEGNVLLWDKDPSRDLPFAQHSLHLWRQLSQDLDRDFELDPKGSILVAEDEAGLEGAAQTVQKLQAAGVRGAVLNAEELHGEEPALADDLPGGALFPDDVQVEPRLATAALVEGAQRHGAEIRLGAPVLAILRGAHGRVQAIQTPTGIFPVGAVVLAAGVWTREIAASTGIDVPVFPRKGHIVVTEKIAGLFRRKLMEAAYTATVGSSQAHLQVAMVAESTRSGSLLLGSSRELSGYDRTVSMRTISAIVSRALRFFPGLEMVRWVRSYAGLRPYSPDHLPLIGPVRGAPGLFLATGHEGAGVCLAPATGELITHHLTGGPAHESDNLFLPDRLIGTLAASNPRPDVGKE